MSVKKNGQNGTKTYCQDDERRIIGELKLRRLQMVTVVTGRGTKAKYNGRVLEIDEAHARIKVRRVGVEEEPRLVKPSQIDLL